MKKKDLKLNMRVEYAAKVDYQLEDGETLKANSKYQYIGFIKGWHTKFFRTYVDICEISTRRVDSVPLRDIFGEIGPRNPNKFKSDTIVISNHEN